MIAPRDEKGRLFTRRCPICDCGTLQVDRRDAFTGRTEWACDGLLDPENPNEPLQACYFTHIDGERPGL